MPNEVDELRKRQRRRGRGADARGPVSWM